MATMNNPDNANGFTFDLLDSNPDSKSLDSVSTEEHKSTDDLVLPQTEWAESEPVALGQIPAHTPRHPRRISELTRQTYEGHLRSLRSMFLKAHPHVDEASPVDLAEFLISRFQSLRPKTVLVYRSALLYCFRNLMFEDPQIEQACLMLTHGLPKSGYKGKKRGQTVTLHSSQSLHKRTFARRDFERLLRFLGARNTQAADEMMDWLLAGLATGLRPAEWQYARWADTNRTQLRVRTLKRHLDKPTLPGISEKTLAQFPKIEYRLVPVHESARETVDAHLRNIANHLRTGQPFDRLYEARRRYLRRACADCFGPKGTVFTLYMMRGQFSANAKKSASANEIAALMGCMPKRVMGNYGSKKAAHRSASEFKPRDQQRHSETDRQQQWQQPNSSGIQGESDLSGSGPQP